jgi:integrase
MFMSKRVQQGSVKLQRKSWIGMWRDHQGGRRSKKLGSRSTMTKTEARQSLLAYLTQLGINEQDQQHVTIKEFVDNVFLPFYKKRKWKESTAETTEDRINYYIKQHYQDRELATFTRDELQTLLDQKAASLSFSTVDHLRRDLKMLFRFAHAEGIIHKDPASLLVTPREARREPQRVMTWQEVKALLAIEFPLRERVIVKLALFTGARPGEILAIKRSSVTDDHIVISQRVYRGKIDTPKTTRSNRTIAIPAGVQTDLREWLQSSPSSEWLFPSENPQKPLNKDNVWGWRIQKGKYQTGIKRFLDKAGLGWVNFQVLRRTHSTLMRDLNVDPKLVADQLGHTLDVNLNVYTSTMLGKRLEAVQGLETAVDSYVN